MLRPSLLIVAIFAISCLPGFFPASSRPWKPTPDAIARDYATITDARPNGELVLLMWIVPRMVAPSTTGAVAAAAMAQKYVMLVVVHGRLDKSTGAVSFDDIDALDARDQSGKPLASVSRNDLPPNSTAMVAALEAVFRQSMGAMGKGMKMFIFDGANVDSCRKGQLSVPFANETYTWDTPFPGCDQKS